MTWSEGYTVLQTEESLWTTGFRRPDGQWEPDEDFDDEDEAEARARWLNSDTAQCVYLWSETGPDYRLYTVGYYTGNGDWHPTADYSDRDEARRAVHAWNTRS